MSLHPDTAGFMTYLRNNRNVREMIKADPDRTLLYAGKFRTDMWRQVETRKRTDAAMRQLQILPEVLSRLSGPPGSPNLKSYVDILCHRVRAHGNDDFIIWRALSGIFASNARGRVYFFIGSEIDRSTKVFAATEVAVLARNPNIDSLTREIVGWLQDCIRTGKTDFNFGFTPAD